MKTLTIEDVENSLKKLESLKHDDEAAHGYEDYLYSEVLEAISENRCENPSKCAELVLKSKEIDFARWCA